ncbi:MAG: rRNA maturation RNase YbeY [Candidatus Rokubacteria bacterium]|nr:rRNA maturation RNase YbeY [Candidatus Rokubacteria bacterium]MBI3824659.1 rRNA maturation RNase YbeY [Candidatus Rokubacteria bacterium]
MSSAVESRQRAVRFSRARLGRAVERALAAVGRPAGLVDLVVVDDREIRRVNAAHRGIRRRTDVIAFPLEVPEAAGGLVGQVVLSAETAARQAARLGVPLAAELDLLVTHGVLHLIGYDDRDPVEAELMHRREREIMATTRRKDRLFTGLLSCSGGHESGTAVGGLTQARRGSGQARRGSGQARRGSGQARRGSGRARRGSGRRSRPRTS